VSWVETYTQKVSLSPKKNLQLLEGVFSEKGGAKEQEAAFIRVGGDRHLDHSAFLGHWGKQRIYTFPSQQDACPYKIGGEQKAHSPDPIGVSDRGYAEFPGTIHRKLGFR
jgi:hypothetical protein